MGFSWSGWYFVFSSVSLTFWTSDRGPSGGWLFPLSVLSREHPALLVLPHLASLAAKRALDRSLPTAAAD